MQKKNADHLCKEESEMTTSNRKKIDCRSFPNENGCTLVISGKENEVLKAAVRHAVEEHGHKDTPDLRKHLRKLLEAEDASAKKII